jgi:hypothetical protein
MISNLLRGGLFRYQVEQLLGGLLGTIADTAKHLGQFNNAFLAC